MSNTFPISIFIVIIKTYDKDFIVYCHSIIRMYGTKREQFNLQKRYRKPIEEFVRRALERYRDRIEGIILFGSVAREEGKEDSDVDILVVTMKEDFGLRHALVGIAFDILLETRANISVKALSKDDFERHKNFSFLRNIISEGVKLV